MEVGKEVVLEGANRKYASLVLLIWKPKYGALRSCSGAQSIESQGAV